MTKSEKAMTHALKRLRGATQDIKELLEEEPDLLTVHVIEALQKDGMDIQHMLLKINKPEIPVMRSSRRHVYTGIMPG